MSYSPGNKLGFNYVNSIVTIVFLSVLFVTPKVRAAELEIENEAPPTFYSISSSNFSAEEDQPILVGSGFVD